MRVSGHRLFPMDNIFPSPPSLVSMLLGVHPAPRVIPRGDLYGIRPGLAIKKSTGLPPDSQQIPLPGTAMCPRSRGQDARESLTEHTPGLGLQPSLHRPQWLHLTFTPPAAGT